MNKSIVRLQNTRDDLKKHTVFTNKMLYKKLSLKDKTINKTYNRFSKNLWFVENRIKFTKNDRFYKIF